MIRNYFLINLILLIIVGFLGYKFHKVYSHKIEMPSEPAVEQGQREKVPVDSEDRVPDASLFQIISNMDLFRPARSPYREDVKQQEAPKIPPRLFGTVILGNEKTAILEDPNTKMTRIYRINDAVGGYVVTDILADKVVMSWNGEKSEVRLREEKKGLPPVRPMMMPQQPQQTPQPVPPPQPQIQPRIPQQPVQRPLPPQRPVTRQVPRTQPPPQE